MAVPKPRLGTDDWLRAGIAALAESGPEALKAEPLARTLKSTKGSFYWHFKDVTDFRARLVAHWEMSAVSVLARAAEADVTAAERLHRLAEIFASGGDMMGSAEPAIRAWAQSNHTVANAVAEVDVARLAYIRTVLSALGLTNPDFARVLYGAYLGMRALPGDGSQNDGALSTLTAALLALQEA
jgi:AcrR family transcriptional regulator